LQMLYDFPITQIVSKYFSLYISLRLSDLPLVVVQKRERMVGALVFAEGVCMVRIEIVVPRSNGEEIMPNKWGVNR